MIRLVLAGSVLAIALAWAPAASADPCDGSLPVKGTRFAGVVRYVGDGDSLCIGPEGRPNEWIEVRLGDFYAPELHARGGTAAKQRLERLVRGEALACRAGRQSFDRVVGYCTLNGRPLGSLLRSAGGTEGGRGWQRRR